MANKKHYIFRKGMWFEFESREQWVKFIEIMRTTGEVINEYAPRYKYRAKMVGYVPGRKWVKCTFQ